MSNTASTDQAAPVPAIRPAPLVVHDDGPLANLMDSARWEQQQRVATALAMASLIPSHLKAADPRATVGNCILVVNQAIRWGLDPFAVAPETYVVGNKLGFSGKLVAAVVNRLAGLRGRLRYEFAGEGDTLTITVIGTFADETEPRTVKLSLRQARTENKMWKTDPEQKLVYSGVVKWARRHCPEVLLGVSTDDDLEHVAATRRDETTIDVVAQDLAAMMTPAAVPSKAGQAKPIENTDMAAGDVIDAEFTIEPALDQAEAQPTAEHITACIADFRAQADGCVTVAELDAALAALEAADPHDLILTQCHRVYDHRREELAAAGKRSGKTPRNSGAVV